MLATAPQTLRKGREVLLQNHLIVEGTELFVHLITLFKEEEGREATRKSRGEGGPIRKWEKKGGGGSESSGFRFNCVVLIDEMPASPIRHRLVFLQRICILSGAEHGL